MTLKECYDMLAKAALLQPNVNTIEDEFLKLNREDIEYSAIVIQERDHQAVGNFMEYSWYLGYVDRLTDDKSNELDIHSTGVNVLKSIINGIKSALYPTVDITANRYITFDQRFTAECAGVYVDVVISVPTSECPDFEFHIGGSDLRTLIVKKNGEYVPVSFDGYDKVVVNVEAGELRPLLVRENGIYEPTDFAGYSKVVVDVPSGVDEEWVRDFTYSKNVIDGKIPSLTGYATQEWVEEQGYLKEHQSLIGYATQEWVEGKGYLTEHQDISNLATKSELSIVEGKIPSLTGYATQEWVDEQGYLKEHQSLEEYAKKSDIPSLIGYATESWVNDRHILLELEVNDNQEITNVVEIFNILKSAPENASFFVRTGEMDIPASISKWGDYSFELYFPYGNYALATASIEDCGAGPAGYFNIIPLASQEWVNSQGYLTQHQDLSAYAKKSDIPSTDGFLQKIFSETDDATTYTTKNEYPGETVYEIRAQGNEYMELHLSPYGFDLSSSTPGYNRSLEWIKIASKEDIPSLDGYVKKSEIDDKWNIETTTTDGSIKAKLDFTPNSTNDNKNFASLGTVRNFYNETVKKTDVFVGTESEWNALTDSQRASYMIALIK